jgi:CRISPR-associated endonuclease Csn1
MGKRLGLALGTNSIGWAILETNEDGPANIVPTNILNAGVRIFSDGRDPQNGDPLAVERRLARAARVRCDRLIRRKSDLRKSLTRLGLFPSDKSEQEKLKSFNPYELRVRALTETLTPYELGRALIHLSQRRGYQSNRKGNQKEDKRRYAALAAEGNLDKQAQKDRDALDHTLKESGLTLGQYLYQRLKEGKGTRARPGEGLTTLRDHYKHEFERIREAQKPHHALSGDDWDKIQHILFFQRDMKPAQRGYCQIYFNDKAQRAWRAMPSFQRFRIEQNLVNLQIIGPDSRKSYLTPDQRAKLRERLLSQKTMGFGKIRTLLGLDESHNFNLETDRRKDIEGDATGALLMKKDYFGKGWNSFDLKKQDEIVARLLEEGNPETLKAVAREEWGLPEHQAQALVDLNDTKLETGTARFSTRALYELIPILSEQGISVTEALEQIRGAQISGGYSNNRPRPRGVDAEPELKYYGEILPDSVVPQPRTAVEDERLYGKINNPTVHIGLNQLRKLINEIIADRGLPDEIAVELSRDLKLSRDAKKNLARKQKDNQDLNEEAGEHIKGQGLAVNDENILRYKLWKELNPGDINDRKSPFSGRNISISQLFSNQIAIDHILPLCRTLDDSYNNKTLCFVDEQRMKRNFSPYEACLNNAWPFDHDGILNRASCLPRKKRYRFEPDAMERWENVEGGFIARQLTDTQYLSKAAGRYLESLYPEDGKIHVHVIPGHLTAKIRRQWGLNSILSGDGSNEENLNDHRHHTIDAVVIGCTDQSLIQLAAARAAQSQELEFAPPFGTAEEFRGLVKDRVDPVIVSHRPDHGCQGAMHEATNYGIIENPNRYEAANNYNVVYRKPFVSLFAGLEPEKARDKAAEIRDARLRHPLINLLKGASSSGDVARIVDAFAKEKGIRHIRLLKKKTTIIPIEHPSSGKKFKKGVVPGKINHVGFWQMPSGEIKAVGRSVFEVYQARGDMNKLKPHPAAKLKMTIYKKDMVRVVKSGQMITCTVVSMSPWSGTFKLRPHNFGESEEFNISFGQLRNYQVRKISITASGQLHDPGPVF